MKLAAAEGEAGRSCVPAGKAGVTLSPALYEKPSECSLQAFGSSKQHIRYLDIVGGISGAS